MDRQQQEHKFSTLLDPKATEINLPALNELLTEITAFSIRKSNVDKPTIKASNQKDADGNDKFWTTLRNNAHIAIVRNKYQDQLSPKQNCLNYLKAVTGGEINDFTRAVVLTLIKHPLAGKFIHEHPQLVHEQTPNGYGLLHFAAASGNLDVITACKEQNVNLLLLDKNQNNALHAALACRQDEVVKQLLGLKDGKEEAGDGKAEADKSQSSALLQQPNKRGRTPLYIAIETDSALTPTLLEGGANPCVQDSKGITPLMAACSLKDFDAANRQAKHLLSHGQEQLHQYVDLRDGKEHTNVHGTSALKSALLTKNTALARRLIEAGANPHLHQETNHFPVALLPIRSPAHPHPRKEWLHTHNQAHWSPFLLAVALSGNSPEMCELALAWFNPKHTIYGVNVSFDAPSNTNPLFDQNNDDSFKTIRMNVYLIAKQFGAYQFLVEANKKLDQGIIDEGETAGFAAVLKKYEHVFNTPFSARRTNLDKLSNAVHRACAEYILNNASVALTAELKTDVQKEDGETKQRFSPLKFFSSVKAKAQENRGEEGATKNTFRFALGALSRGIKSTYRGFGGMDAAAALFDDVIHICKPLGQEVAENDISDAFTKAVNAVKQHIIEGKGVQKPGSFITLLQKHLASDQGLARQFDLPYQEKGEDLGYVGALRSKWHEQVDYADQHPEKEPVARYARLLRARLPGEQQEGTGISMVDVSEVPIDRDDSESDPSPPTTFSTSGGEGQGLL